MAIVGMPIPAMGHSQYCSIAMTTGGPDTSDVYEEEVNPTIRDNIVTTANGRISSVQAAK